MWMLAPCPGIEPVPPAVEACCLNHWTAREVPFMQLWRSSGPLGSMGTRSIFERVPSSSTQTREAVPLLCALWARAPPALAVLECWAGHHHDGFNDGPGQSRPGTEGLGQQDSHGVGALTHLQQEPRALRHELQGHHGHGAGQSADDDKHSPAVEVVVAAHAEAPACEEAVRYAALFTTARTRKQPRCLSTNEWIKM